MDSHQLSPYALSGQGISFKLASTSISSYPELLGVTRPDLCDLSDSPLSDCYGCGTFLALDNSQEYSSTETLSGLSPSQNSPLDADSSYTLVSIQENLQATKTATLSDQGTLKKIETLLMAPETDEASTSWRPGYDESQQREAKRPGSETWNQECQQEFSSVHPPYMITKHQKTNHGTLGQKHHGGFQEKPLSDIRQLLMACAEALSEGKIDMFERLVEETRKKVSISGDPAQRLGAYILEGLVARRESSGSTIYGALRCKEPESKDLLSYMQVLYEVCPYLKFGYMAANGAIAEAIRKEDRVHIIDFQVAQGTQWLTLIQALAARPGGPPHLRITGIDDPVSRYARGNDLQAVGERLDLMSKKFKIPLEFHAVPVFSTEVTREMLDIRPGEALAVNFTLHLHHTPDESVDVNNPRDGLLRMVKSLSPKVTTLVEQESNTNTAPFLMRFAETLDYYTAMFESMDVTLPRESKERISVEQHCLAKDVVNIIACEGKDRVERHELLGKWKSRLSMAGFRPYPLSRYINSVIRTLLMSYSDKYTLLEKDGAMLLGWKDRNLVSASAWH